MVQDKNIIELTDKNFEKYVFLSKEYVLVEFWADWCNPCKILSPILEEVSKDYSEKILVGKINIDSNPIIPAKYSIRGIPTLLLFYKKKVLDTKIGALSKIELIEFLKNYIK